MVDYNLRFYDSSIGLVGELDDADAVIWNMTFRGYGKFQINFSTFHPECFQKNFFVKFDRDKYKTGIIKNVLIDESDGGISVVIKGYTLAWLLTQRITVPPAGYAQYTYRGVAEDGMIALVDANAGSSADANRQMGITFSASLSRGASVSVATRYKNLLDELTSIGEQTGLGYTVYLDTENKEMIFEVLEGTDRTWSQSEVSVVCFSPKNDNVTGRMYQTDDSTLKNCAFVGGQGEGANRSLIMVGDEADGLDRYEIFVDARDISDSSALAQRGASKLAGYPAVNCYECDVDPSGFDSKWFLGDLVSVRDHEYGVSLDMQVTAVNISVDKVGRTVTPTFGVAPKTNRQRIDQLSASDSVV